MCIKQSICLRLGLALGLLSAALRLPADSSAAMDLGYIGAGSPRINGPHIFGVRPDVPFLYTIPALGAEPLFYSVEDLPGSLRLDPQTGQITGTLSHPGEFPIVFRVSNGLGAAEKKFTIRVGEEIGLTPSMGWNSYNCFGERITQDLALRAAHRLVQLGLNRHGWTYVNMDDGWQGARTGPNYALAADPQTFPDIKAMVAEIHHLGLKAGLYSSPWVQTYGGRLGGSAENPAGGAQKWPSAPHNAKKLPFAIGKYRFTYADARQFAAWGFDYLKYDWGPVEAPETEEMHQAIRASGRAIIFSLSNNHIRNLLPIIDTVSPWAQSWRTTTDIRDNWGRVAFDIGFAQEKWAGSARPGHFNDADMLVVGTVGGWSGPTGLHPTHLTPEEQYSHVSLWCLLASPLLIGCDLEQMDAFTLTLLTNDEVIAIDQDSLGRPAVQVGGQGEAKIYARPLEDGSLGVGMFNLSSGPMNIPVNWSELNISGPQAVRDLWRQAGVGTFDNRYATTVPGHGVCFLKISPVRLTR